MTAVASLAAAPPLPPEEEARAAFYALLGTLYAAPPDALLLAAIDAADPIEADPAASALAEAWSALRLASSTTDADRTAREYQDLFVGVGKSEVNLHASYYLSGFMMERPLADIRGALARLGLTRRAGVNLVEDHLASVCETMRALIAGFDGTPEQTMDGQRLFFEAHVAPWAFSCCAALKNSSLANYYAVVAQFTEVFLAIERDSFAIDRSA